MDDAVLGVHDSRHLGSLSFEGESRARIIELVIRVSCIVIVQKSVLLENQSRASQMKSWRRMAERVGFDPLNAEPFTALHGHVPLQEIKHLSGFRLPPDLIDVF
jgi:hypothetical protein